MTWHVLYIAKKKVYKIKRGVFIVWQFKRYSSPKIKELTHYLLALRLFKTFMSFFLLLNTTEDIFDKTGLEQVEGE